jgi:BirA family biotin operon repressor/biotin-[acetyl-CoA-carboxylase] ligase
MNLKAFDSRFDPVVEILALLKKNSGRFYSSREISEALNINRHLAYESIAFLRDQGYNIEASKNHGYRLLDSPDLIIPVEILAGLKCKLLANRIFSYSTIDSTNIAAHQYAKSGLPEGTLVIADSQTRGRGRMGRKWHSSAGKGLYFSLILRPELAPDRVAGLSLMAGLAVIRAIIDLAEIDVRMKWPNDILFHKKKLAGILVELVAELDGIEYMIVGIGVNVNHGKRDFPLSLQYKSTSLKIITKKDLKRAVLLQKILTEFESLYQVFCSHGFKYISAELIKHSAVISNRVTIKSGKKKFSGKAVGFDDIGCLLIRTKNGLRSFSAGEVTLR